MDSIGVVMTVLILGCTDTVVLALDCMLIIMDFTDVTALMTQQHARWLICGTGTRTVMPYLFEAKALCFFDRDRELLFQLRFGAIRRQVQPVEAATGKDQSVMYL